jgi:hypothetical protein
MTSNLLGALLAPVQYRSSIGNAYRAVCAALIALSLGVIAACGGGADDRPVTSAASADRVGAFSHNTANNGSNDDICNAPTLSTVLMPVPTGGGGGGAGPINVKIHYNRASTATARSSRSKQPSSPHRAPQDSVSSCIRRAATATLASTASGSSPTARSSG